MLDHIVDIGPGAGVHGGEVCAQGTAKEIAKSKKLNNRRVSLWKESCINSKEKERI
jgi:Excinuclease ATPase subunit